MSKWTHIAGIVRVGSLILQPSDAEKFKNQLKKHFGVTCDWGDDEKVWDECNVPCGSEGSVQYILDRTGTDSSVSFGTITIYGDLRDYGTDEEEDVKKIFDWIKQACDGLMVRDCAVKVNVEYGGSYLIHQKELENYEHEIVMVSL